MQKLGLIGRAVRSVLAAAVVAAAITVVNLTVRHKLVAAQAAAGHQSTAAVLVNGFAGITVLLGAVLFLIGFLPARIRRRPGAQDGALPAASHQEGGGDDADPALNPERKRS
jgi:hypothetical protein